MNASVSFPSFGALPTELRLKIWEEALSMTSVWTVTRKDALDEDDEGRPLQTCQVHPIGSAPFLIGLVCRDARRQLEHSFKVAPSGPRGLFRITGAQLWLDMDRTVFYLGEAGQAKRTLAALESHSRSLLRVVAIRWDHWGVLARTCIYLAGWAPHLHTILLQRAGKGENHTPLDAKTAAHFAKASTGTAFAEQDQGLDWEYFRGLLLPYFGDTPTSLHLMPPDNDESPV